MGATRSLPAYGRHRAWPGTAAKLTATVSGRSRCDLHHGDPTTDCHCPENMARAGRVAHISCAFADRNSLLAGNLTGNSQNRAEFASFRASGADDRVTCQDVRHEFPGPGEHRELRGITGTGTIR